MSREDVGTFVKSSEDNQGLLIFDDRNPSASDSSHQYLPWKILIVDDDDSIHRISTLLLERFSFLDRGVSLLYAKSKAEAIEQLAKHPDTALILLDVVMEEERAGLQLVEYIRNELRNNLIQIVLRTGQPAIAPESESMRHYKISGYLLKSDMDEGKIQSRVIAGLRTFDELHSLDLQAHMPEHIASLFLDDRVRNTPYKPVLLEKLCSLLGMSQRTIDDCSGIYGCIPMSRVTPSSTDEDAMRRGYAWDFAVLDLMGCNQTPEIFSAQRKEHAQDRLIYALSTQGRFQDFDGIFPTPEFLKEVLSEGLAQKKNIYKKDWTLIYSPPSGTLSHLWTHFIYLENVPPFDQTIMDCFFAELRKKVMEVARDFYQ